MCFGKAFHLILMHFYFLYSMLWGVFSKIRLFFLKICFSRFSIDPNCFSINRISWIRFFKNGSWLFQKFSLSLSLSLRFELGSTSDFCRFLSFFFQGFSLQILVRPFYPSFCFYFLISCILIWGFWTCTYLGFLMIKAIFSEIDHWVLFLWCF